MDTPPPLNSISDEELMRSINQDLKALETGQPGTQEPQAPELKFDDVLKGLRKSEVDRAGSDPVFAQKMLERHQEFQTRTAAGENPMDPNNPGDFELYRWQEATKPKGQGPGVADLIGAGIVSTAKGIFQLGVEGIKSIALGSSPDPYFKMRASREDIDLATVGAAKELAMNNSIVRSVGSLVHKGYTSARKLFANDSQRELLGELSARHSFDAQRTNVADYQTAEKMHQNISLLVPSLAGIVGTTEVNQAAADIIGEIPETLVEGGVALIASRGRRAIATGAMRQAVTKLADVRDDLAAKLAVRDTLSAAGDAAQAGALKAVNSEIAEATADVAVREQAIQKLTQEAQKEFDDLTKVATSRVAAGKTLGTAGKAIEKVGGLAEKLEKLPRHLAEKIAPNSPELHGAIERGLMATAATGVGYAVGDKEGAAVGGLLGAVGSPKMISRLGRDVRRVGEVFEMGQAVLPFWRNVQKARDVSGFLRGASSFLDNSTISSLSQFTGGIARGAAAGGAVGAAFGALQNPEDPLSAAAQGFGSGLVYGGSVGMLGQWRQYANSGQMMRERAAQTRVYKDLLQARPDELKVYEKLPVGQQEQIALYMAAHPDVRVNYVNDPHLPPGNYDALARPDVVTVNLASNDPLTDIVGHEIAHYTENHELGDSVVKRALGDPEAGIPGDFTARDPETGAPLYEGGDLKKFKVNEEFMRLQQAYLDRLDATGKARGWTDQEITAAKQSAMDPEYIAREIWAEQHLAYLQSEKYVSDLKGHYDVPDWVMNHAFLKNALGKLGVAFKPDGEIIESTILGDYKKSETFNGLMREYYRRRAAARSGDIEFIGGETKIDEAKLTKETGYVERYFDASGEIARDKDGAPLYDPKGNVILRARRDAEADAKVVGKALVAHLDGEVKGDNVDPNVVQKRTTADGRTVYAGRYLSDAAIEAIGNTQRFNAVQMENLRQLNAELKAGYGREWTSFYQAATRKGSGSQYRSLSGRWRTDLVYGFQVTSDNNIVAQSVSLEVLAKNAAEAVGRGVATPWNNELGPLLGDVRTYLDNLTSGKPGDTGLGAEKKNFINNLLGIRVKSEGDVNPWFEVSKAPKTILTSLRLDRMNRLSPVAERNVPFSSESYRRAAQNLRPDEVHTNEGAQEAGEPGTMGAVKPKTQRAVDAGAKAGQPSVRGNGPRVVGKNGRGADDAARTAQAGAPRSDAAPVQHAGKRLEHAVADEPIQLVHYTGNGDLKAVDPKFLGRGQATQNDLRGLPKSFFYQQGSKLGADKGLVSGTGKSAYGATVSGARIYDANTDALGYWDILNREKADQMLVDQGYVGLAVKGDDGRKTVSMFKPTKVTRVGNSGNESRAQLRPESMDFKEFEAEVEGGTLTPEEIEDAVPPLGNVWPTRAKASLDSLPGTPDYKEFVKSFGKRVPTQDQLDAFFNSRGIQLRPTSAEDFSKQMDSMLGSSTKNGEGTVWTKDGVTVRLSGSGPQHADNILSVKIGDQVFLDNIATGHTRVRAIEQVAAEVARGPRAKTPPVELIHAPMFRPDAPRVVVSPNKGNIDYATAKQRLTESEHRAFVTKANELAHAVDPDAVVQSGLGDWVDGAEDSVSIQFSRGTDPDAVARVAAQLGLDGEQKAVMQLVPDDNGKSTLFEVKFAKGTSIDDARQALIDSGIEQRTLLPTEDGIMAFVFDEERVLANEMAQLAAHELAPSIEEASVRPATGDSVFLGSFKDRQEGANAFRRVLSDTPGSGNQAEAVPGAYNPAGKRIVFGEPSHLYRKPNDASKEYIIAAALKFEDGKTFIGGWHAEAGEVAQRHYGLPPDAQKFSDGFYTNRGRFVSRGEGLRIVKAQAAGRREIASTYDLDSYDLHAQFRPEAVEHPDFEFGLTGDRVNKAHVFGTEQEARAFAAGIPGARVHARNGQGTGWTVQAAPFMYAADPLTPRGQMRPDGLEADDLSHRVSTRLPTAKKATDDALASQLTITSKEVLAEPEKVTVIGNLLKKYPNLASKGRAVEVIQEMHDVSVENILWLHDQMTPELRQRARKWYDGGRRLTEQWSKQHNLPRPAVAGVLASLSPQKDWFMNVDLARRTIEHHKALQGRQLTDGLVDWFDGKFGKKAPENVIILRDGIGKNFEELTLYQKAVFLRAYDEVNHSRGYQVITPEGDFSGTAKNMDGKPSKVAWGDFGVIAKAISIVEDPSRANISVRLGQEHKVRSFYNNLLLPRNEDHGDVTIDTHAVAAAHLRPLAGEDDPVKHNFGANGAPSSSITGASGTYGLYADAYREAAAARNLLPREMQSIAWEAVRGLFTPEFKTAENKAAVDAIWKRYKNGSITLANARNQILDLSGGISTPSWAVPGTR
jgi:hypothetical protein